MLEEVIGNNIDVLLTYETKLGTSFLSSQFILDGFTPPYRLDRTQHRGGIILFIREGVPSKLLNANTSFSGIENRLVEINLCSQKWLISGSYNPHINSIENHLVQLSKMFDFYSSKYENFIVLGDVSTEMTNTHREFCSVYNFKSLMKDPTCFKNPEKPTTIDHILIIQGVFSILVLMRQACLAFTDSHELF